MRIHDWMLYDEIVNALDAHDHEEEGRLG